MARRPIVFNGKFLSAETTGVHRVAGQLISHVDRLLAAEGGRAGRDWSMACPRDAHGVLDLSAVTRRRAGHLTWQAWEQWDLPRDAQGAVLINLCNLAPLSHPNSVTMIHDAQVFLTPESYSPAFRAWYRYALPRIGRRALRIVTVSEYSRDRLVEFGVAPRDRISVLLNGADHLLDIDAAPDILDRLGLRPGGYVAATASTQTHKNLAVLFKTFADGAMGDLRLVLIGGAGPAAFVKAGIPAPSGVVFAGRVSDGEMKALYQGAACLAFPSTTEGFGLPPLEAMSLGCPAIVAPCGALPEICGEAALFAAPDAPAEWARAIREVVDDTVLRRRMTEAGSARAALYRWSESARRLMDIIESVA